MTELAVSPFLVLLLGALLSAWARGIWRTLLQILVPAAALCLVWRLPDGATLQVAVGSLHLTPFRVDALSRLFALVFTGLVFAAAVYALRQPRRSEIVAALCSAAGALGVVLAGDLVTLTVAWACMVVAAGVVVGVAGGHSRRAALRFGVMHGLATLLLAAGVVVAVASGDSPTFAAMASDRAAHWLIVAALLIGAATLPLSAWLPDAYPQASWSGTVFLSLFVTNAAVYALIRGFAGTTWFVPLGLVMALYGIVYGVRENDMRRLLAYAMVGQIGLMLVGIGIGTPLALDGAAALAAVHALAQALLLMAAGAVLRMSGESRLSALGGLCRSMPLTALCAGIGAATLAAAPLTAGFLAQPLIAQAAADAGPAAIWYLVTAAAAGVVLHGGFKFPWLVFFHRDSGLSPPDPPASMRLAMVLLSGCCLGFGLAPDLLQRLLPHAAPIALYTPTRVLAQLQLLLFATLGFLLLRSIVVRSLGITLDIDWFWRRHSGWLLRQIERGGAFAGGQVRGVSSKLGSGLRDATRDHWQALRGTAWTAIGPLVWDAMRRVWQKTIRLALRVLAIERA